MIPHSSRAFDAVPALSMLGRRAAAWARSIVARPDMSLLWSCCGTPTMAGKALVTRKGRSPFMLASCGHCGAQWSSGSDALSQAGEWRPMPAAELEAMLREEGATCASLFEAWTRDRT